MGKNFSGNKIALLLALIPCFSKYLCCKGAILCLSSNFFIALDFTFLEHGVDYAENE